MILTWILAAEIVMRPASGTHLQEPTSAEYSCAERVDVKSVGATGNGSTDDGPAILLAARRAQACGEVRFPRGRYKVKHDLVLGSDSIPVALSFADGALLVVDRGATVKLFGPLRADPRAIFSGEGRILLGNKSVDVIYPEWWGAVADDKTDSTAGLQAALDSAGGLQPATVRLAGHGYYRVSNTLRVPTRVWLVGQGQGGGGLRFTYDSRRDAKRAVAIVIENGYYQGIRDLNIEHVNRIDPAAYGDNGSGTAIQFPDTDGLRVGTDPAQYTTIERVRIKYFTTGARVVSESTWLRFVDVIAEFCGVGFSVSEANFTSFVRVIADHCQSSWYLQRTAKTVLDHCTAQVNYSTHEAAIQIVDSSNVEVVGLWTERNQSDGIAISGASKFIRITESLVQGSGFDIKSGKPRKAAVGIRIGGVATGTIVDGGVFGGNAGGDIEVEGGAIHTSLLRPRSEVAMVVHNSGKQTQWVTGDDSPPSSR